MREDRLEINSVGRLLSRASRSLNSRIMGEFSDCGIGVGQLYSLLALYDNEGICQNDICDIYSLDRSAVGRSLKKLEDKGFIERRPDPEDNRRKRVYLREKGKDFRSECMKRLKSMENDIRGVLTPKETKVFVNAIEKICKALECGAVDDKSELAGEDFNIELKGGE